MFKSTLSTFSFICILSCYILLPEKVLCQDANKDPTFESFDGVVYAMPKILQKINGHLTKTIVERYTKRISTYDSLTTISLTDIDIQESHINDSMFPGVVQSTKFCMLLHSKMTIKEAGMYEFMLNSDDGSILWIDEEEVVNNDGGHPMKLTKNTVPLSAGIYPIRLWYFQGHPDRFGFQFEAFYKGPIPQSDFDSGNDTVEIEFPSDLLFGFKESTLSQEAKQSLDQLIGEINFEVLSAIEIIGHTDGVGNQEDNQKLSIRRARSVAEYLGKFIKGDRVVMEVSGKGESVPIASNDTKEGRAQNRRVQIRYY